jgi:RimJ/RimL family protein N-acetyltransferase
VLTDRLELRPPLETDRARFVELFRNDDFMQATANGYLNDLHRRAFS